MIRPIQSTRVRDYRETDYAECEQLVSDAWQFEQHFQPAALYQLARHVYTYGSVVGSNFKQVVEQNGQVVGFLFGRNEKRPLEQGCLKLLRFNLWVLKRLFGLKGMTFKQKFAFLKKLNQHEIARHKIEKRGASEINLLVIHPSLQKQGFGQQVVQRFIKDCRSSRVPRIIVEANVVQASGFYKKLGFTLLAEFDSPLHQIASKDTPKAALYEYRL